MPRSLTPILVRVRDSGMTLQAENGDLVVRPKGRLTPALKTELVHHKPELLALLAWDEGSACALLGDALAYIAEAYARSGTSDSALAALDDPGDTLNEAYAREDMFLLRIAVREWVESTLGAFETAKQDRSVA